MISKFLHNLLIGAYEMVLNKKTGIPLYYQLKEIILGEIKKGTWRVGEQIPTEIDFVDQYKISRATVRQAVLELVRDGILVRDKGKGTFVSAPKFRTDFTVNFCYPEQFGDKHKVLSAKTISPSESIAERLSLTSTELIYKIVRLRYFNDEPVAIETLFIPEKKFPGLLDKDLKIRIFDILAENYNVNILKFETTIEPVTLTYKESKILEVSKEKPALLVEKNCLDITGRPYLIAKGLFRGDRCKLFFETK